MDARNLSQHLTELEFIDTAHRELADEQERCWRENAELQHAAREFALTVFEPARAILGPLRVSSGYRCPALNKAVGGVGASRHMVGLAADVVPLRIGLVDAMVRLREAMRVGDLPYLDELIFEHGRWLHLQAALPGGKPRQLALMTFAAGSYLAFDVSDPRIVARRVV